MRIKKEYFTITLLLKILITISLIRVAISSGTEHTPKSVKRLNSSETTALLDQLMKRMDYRVRPNINGEAEKVHCGIYIISFGSISNIDMDYTMDIYLRQSWYDHRLAFTNVTYPITLNARLIANVWTPDLYFPHEKKASFHDVTVPNKLIRIYPDGKVFYSLRITLTSSCHMDLSKFPMDSQECDFKIASYLYESDDISLQWYDEYPIEIEEKIELPQFDLTHASVEPCEIMKYKSGSYPCIRATFGLTRQFGFFLLQTYIPSILIVIISWVSFWINQNAVPARISLGVTTVLTMATQLSGSIASIPRVSYPKAIDIWMSTCMIFVFGALIEYAFVNAISRRDMKYKKHLDDNKHDPPSESKDSSGASEQFRMNNIQSENANKNDQSDTTAQEDCVNTVVPHQHSTSEVVDRTCRYIFPSVFVVFNIVYWTYYRLA